VSRSKSGGMKVIDLADVTQPRLHNHQPGPVRAHPPRCLPGRQPSKRTTPILVTVAGSVATSPQVGPVISMAALQFMSSCRNLLA
jgi:hypothetical protein